MKNLFTILLASALSGSIYAQAPVIQWQKAFGGSLEDSGGSITKTSDGGYLLAGSSASNDGDVTGNQGGLDWWVVKVDNLGAIQWETTLGGSADEILYRAIQTSDGGYALAGWTESNDGDVTGYQGNKDCWVAKLNSSGVLQWQNTIGGTAEEEFRYIIETNDGGLACSGWSFSNDGDASGLHGFRDGWLVKLDASGNVTWQKMLGGLNDERGYTVEQTTDNGYIFAALSNSTTGDVSGNYGNLDYWLVKTDSVGTIQWENNYGGTSQENTRGAIQTSDGGYLITGYTFSSDIDIVGSHGGQEMFLVKVDNTGAIQWTKSLGGSGTDRGAHVIETADGGFISSGFTASSDGDVSNFQGGFGDYWIVKLTSAGAISWEKTVGGTAFDQGGRVVEITNGIVAFGNTNSTDGDVTGNHGQDDLWMVKMLFSCAPGSVTGAISGDASICSGGSTNLTLNFTGTAPFFYSINGGATQTALTSPATVSVSPVANTVYTLTTVSDDVCPSGTTSGSATVSVSNAGPGNTTKVTVAPTSACSGDVAQFTARLVGGQNIQYRWTGPAGTLFGTNIGGPFSAGPFSTTTNQVYVQFGTLAANSSGYNICVQGYNGCGQTNNNCYWVRGLISAPSAITGSTTACAGETKTYSVNVPTGAQLFTWTFSVPGAVITPTTPTGNIVDVTFPAYTSGTLCVTAALTCGGSSTSAARCLDINSTPAKPGVISGPASACGGATVAYSIAAVSGAISYTWTFPTAGTLIDGNASPYTTNATSVNVTFPAGYNQNQSLCVTANNSCNSSASRCKTIGNQVPAQPAPMASNPATWCNNGVVDLSVTPVAGATSYAWSLSNGTINSGQGTSGINVTWGTGAGNASVIASNACGNSTARTLFYTPTCREGLFTSNQKSFSIFPNPSFGSFQLNFEHTGGNYAVRIMNMNGQLVYQETQTGDSGFIQHIVNLNDIKPGVYIVEFSNQILSEKTRLVIE